MQSDAANESVLIPTLLRGGGHAGKATLSDGKVKKLNLICPGSYKARNSLL